MSDKVIIFDTTLRDGEQCPGASMNLREKMEIARQLERLNVDVIEAGFPVISDGDFEAVKTIAEEIKGPVICGLARCIPKDIDAAGAALKAAGPRGRIHTFISTSKIQVEHQLKKQVEDVVPIAIACVKQARQYVKDVEFSPMDATRTDPEFMARLLEAVIEAGATTVNIPDTVGYAMPEQYAALISYLRANVRNIDDAVISVHCHDDLGLAVANSLAAIKAGARQVEGTFNGIGERAGNCALEEVVMTLKTRPDFFDGIDSGVVTREILRTSRLIARMSGLQVARSKAIVGENAFAHGSGIHQDGILKKRETYEIMDPVEIGWGGTELPLTKHSGRHAIVARLEHLGFRLTDGEVEAVFTRFKQIGDKKKFVYDDDLSALVDDSIGNAGETFALDYIRVISDSLTVPSATVRLKKGEQLLENDSSGNGAVDAAMQAIDGIVDRKGVLASYHVEAVTQGRDSLGEVTVKIDFGDGQFVTGKGAATDVIEASARAYLNAINRSFALMQSAARRFESAGI
jgi:2-isopropylmalate synthase